MSTQENQASLESEEKKRKNEEKKKAKAAEKAEKANKAKEKEAKMKALQQAQAAKKEKEGEKVKEVRIKKDFVNKTPIGEKKDITTPLADAYDPPSVEAAWYDWWMKCGFFDPAYGNPSPDNEKFTIVIPPPNVTGSLHLGHALTNSVQDALVRWHRMLGHTTLWVPGTDHAGIATQTIVEKRLQREKGKTRHDLGREPFIAEVWKWKDEYKDRICSQLKRLGSSLDWNREAFTMDENLSRAVIEAFVQLYEQDKMYRATRLVNWCSALKTAISDVEVDFIELEGITKLRVPGHGEKLYEFGALWEFAYKVDGSEDELVVATTRPETMLADTAVAIHSKDERYKHLHGKFVVHPFNHSKIPIILDDILVDMTFGTGAVKVTPGHDPNDYEVGLRHKLPMPELLTDDGEINEFGGEFKGLKRFDARNAVIEGLKKLNLYRGIKPNKMRLSVCSRSKDVIEPRLKPQWWVKCGELAERAIAAVKSGELKFSPKQQEDTWNRWMGSIRDWCVSRQLWWGHRIPAYYVTIKDQPRTGDDDRYWVVGRTREEALANAQRRFEVPADHIQLEQDPDVLDTWFSSGLFPFSVFGWPNNTEDMQKFYPTTLLETGQDIIFFWVARMVFFGQQLTGKLPFSQVLLHSMVRDAHGRKMSKMFGNVIDPIDVIEGISLEGLHEQVKKGNLDPREVEKAVAGQKADFPKGIAECGTDALRFALCSYTSQGRDINLDIKRVEAYRNFCNKIWNASRFVMMKIESSFNPSASPAIPANASLTDLWILSRLSEAVTAANSGLESFNFAQATTGVYNFWLYDLCDVYLELIKPVFYVEGNEPAKAATRETLYICLEIGLKLLHPFMPFVTEELYQRLPRRPSDKAPSIMVSRFPTIATFGTWKNAKIESDVQTAQEVVRAIRGIRASYNVVVSKRPTVVVSAKNDALHKVVSDLKEMIKTLSLSGDVAIQTTTDKPQGSAIGIVSDACEVYVDIRDLVDINAEISRLETKRTQTNTQRDALLKKINIPNYEKNVPAEIRSTNAQKLSTLEQEIATMTSAIEDFSKLRITDTK